MSHNKKNTDSGIEAHKLELTQFCIDNAVDSIFWISKSGHIVYANKAAVELLGYSRDELLAMTVHDIDPNYPRSFWDEHWNLVKTRSRLSFESNHIAKSGEKIPVEIRVNHLQLGDIEFNCAFVRNISAQKNTEKTLIESEGRLRKTLDVTSDGVWDRNLVTGEVYYGAKWATVLGYSEEDLQTGKISWESLLHNDDREKTVKALREHLQGKTESYEAEFRLRNSRNKWQWIHARGRIIEYDEDGKPLRFVGTHTDVTSRKRLETSLQKNSEDTKLFAYSVAHDLKNPSIAIRGLAEQFRRKFDSLPETKKLMYCDRIIEASEQLVDLVGKINSFISAKEAKLELEAITLKEVVRACKNEFTAQLQYRSIIWQEFDENPTVRVDKLAMVRVLRNLVENSLKYGGPQLSRISIGYHNTLRYHVVSVRDDGVGMTVEDSKRIFQPFERKATPAEQSGSGLGLAIVKAIAEQHKGEVWVEPNRIKGIKFCFAVSKYL